MTPKNGRSQGQQSRSTRDCPRSPDEPSTVIADRACRTLHALRTVSESTAAVSGDRFFAELVLSLTRSLGVQFVFIGEATTRTDGSRGIQTLAVCSAGEVGPNFGYGLEGTPCAGVIDGGTCVYRSDVQGLFPEDLLLSEMGVESYVGCPVLDVEGRPLGLLVVLDTKPMTDDVESIQFVLEASVGRIGAELEQRRVRTQLLEAKNSAERADRAKGRFLANMSHEMRTPLNGILGTAEFLLSSNIEGVTRELVESSAATAHYLLGIVNNVLALTSNEPRTEAEDDEVDIDLYQFLNEMRVQFLPMAAERDVDLVLEFGPLPQRHVRGHRFRIRQIMDNLISNAIKFTEAGGRIIISVQDQAGTAGGKNRQRFSVVDNGIGVPEDLRTRVFDPFFQADDSTTRRFGGVGLGLAVARRVAESLGGTLTVEKPGGRGSRFDLILELPPTVSADGPNSARGSRRQTMKNIFTSAPRVLLVEDHPINRLIATRLLERLGCSVCHASDGLHALQLFEPGRFDFVLMDLHMPRMDGYEASRLIHSRDPNVPIAALTAETLGDTAKRCRDCGMVEHLSKPIEIARLQRVLEQYLPTKLAS